MKRPEISRKLLIIDDDPGFSEVLTGYLGRAGFEVLSAGNLETAIQLFRAHLPRVVLLDFQMPVATGEKMVPILQTLDPHFKAIVISGYPSDVVEEKFKGLGYFAFFEKSKFSLESLRTKVEEAFSA